MNNSALQPGPIRDQKVSKKCRALQSGSAMQSQTTLLVLIQSLAESLSQQAMEAEQRSRQLRTLAVELTHAEERERRRFARILHDDLQQTLAAAHLRAGMVKIKTDDPELIEALAHLEELIAEAVAASRSLTSDLCPPAFYAGNFASSLDWLAREAREKHGLEVSICVDAQADPGSQEIRSILIRGVRELLFNVAKHAKVRVAAVVVVRAASGMRIVVEDQGVGFDPAASTDTACGGFGLCSIRERLACLGGSFELFSAPGQGTRAVFVVPGERPQAGLPRNESNVGNVADATQHSPTQGIMTCQITTQS